MKKQLKLDLACGQNKQKGFIGVDIAGDCDIKMDLTKFPWKFKSNSVDELHCSHFVEHLDGETFIKFIDECWRIMKKGAKMQITAPYYTSMRAWQDPTHKQAICEAKFLYFNKKWRQDNKLDHYPIKSDFDFSYGYNILPEIGVKSDDFKMFAIAHYWNVVADLVITLTKR